MKKLFKSKRGIVGIEAAIVLIAFVIIAAALSYVVINMGFYTAQKTKETMATGLEESLAALQLDGTVTGKTDGSSRIKWVVLPVKLSAGRGSIDLKNETLVVSVYLPNATLLDVYQGVYNETEPDPTDLEDVLTDIDGTYDGRDVAVFIIYKDDEDSVLEATEKAFLIIRLQDPATVPPYHTIGDYDIIKIEVKGAKGAALTVVRAGPGGMLPNAFVDLG